MSKYIKLEEAIHNINLEVTGRKEYTGDMKANLFFALDDLPTIEVSEKVEDERCKGCKHYKLACDLFSEICKYEPITQTETQNSNLTFEIADTPKTKVSEDCISRAEALDEFKKDYEDIVDLMTAIEELPSVMPSGTIVECYYRNCEKNKNGKCEEDDIILEFGCGC